MAQLASFTKPNGGMVRRERPNSIVKCMLQSPGDRDSLWPATSIVWGGVDMDWSTMKFRLFHHVLHRVDDWQCSSQKVHWFLSTEHHHPLGKKLK